MIVMDVGRRRQSERHRLPSCYASVAPGADGSARYQFILRLDGVDVNNSKVMFELQQHGFTRTRDWVPYGPFHDRFPLGAQVTRAESTVAYVYTKGSSFAFKANELCRNSDWTTLFAQYGQCMSCMWSYAEKMQSRYGKWQTLYRGMPGVWAEFLQQYPVGHMFEWQSFTSVSTNRDAAFEFAAGIYSGGNQYPNRPVLFAINTLSRGAPLFSWSAYPDEDEVLFLPFQRFRVTDVEVANTILIISLDTICPDRREMLFKVVACPGVAYRYSRHVHDRDGNPAGPIVGDVVRGFMEGSQWIVTTVQGVGDRFLPILIDGDMKLRPINREPQIIHHSNRFHPVCVEEEICRLSTIRTQPDYFGAMLLLIFIFFCVFGRSSQEVGGSCASADCWSYSPTITAM